MNRNARFWLVLLALLILVVILIGGSGSDGPRYDPRSVSPDGARGIVETLERLGADVELDAAVPDASSTSALMLQNRLTSEDQQQLRSWVLSGGVLVVADLSNELAAQRLGVTQPSPDPEQLALLDREFCSIDALEGVNRLRASGRLLDAFGVESCFGDGNRAFVVSEELGDGTVVTIGSPDVFTNEFLGTEDAAALALTLLAPNRGGSSVTFVGPSQVDFGEERLTDLVPPRVRNAILQFLAAFLLYALYRSRRLGGVVTEPLPVHIEGSELVLKAGLLSERAKDPVSAVKIVRDDVLQRARKTMSIPATVDDAAVAERIAARSGLDIAYVQAALLHAVATDADLLRTTQMLSDIDRRLYEPSETESQTR